MAITDVRERVKTRGRIGHTVVNGEGVADEGGEGEDEEDGFAKHDERERFG